MAQAPLDWLLGLGQFGIKFGLDNMRAIVGALGHPERAFRAIHVGGTNGKGSVTAMIEAALRLRGLRTGRYTSPHLLHLAERFAHFDGLPAEPAHEFPPVPGEQEPGRNRRDHGRHNGPDDHDDDSQRRGQERDRRGQRRPDCHDAPHDRPHGYECRPQGNGCCASDDQTDPNRRDQLDRFAIGLDPHERGRSDLFDDVDLSRTVGWFTTRFPVTLRSPADGGLPAALKSIKEQLRGIPNGGIGYGVLRYLAHDLPEAAILHGQPEPEIGFNYLGRFDQLIGNTA